MSRTAFITKNSVTGSTFHRNKINIFIDSLLFISYVCLPYYSSIVFTRKEVIMEFPQALDYQKHTPYTGAKINRSGWNGTGMFVCLQTGYPDGIVISKNTADATGLPEGSEVRFLPYLMFKTARGDFVPWVASQTDLLENYWEIVA